MEYLDGLPQRLLAFANAGFDGVEYFFVDIDASQFTDICQETGLEFNAGMVAPIVEAFWSELKRALQYRPSLIDCHG